MKSVFVYYQNTSFFTISSPRLNKKKEKHNKSTWFAIQVTVLKRIIQIASHARIHPPDHTC